MKKNYLLVLLVGLSFVVFCGKKENETTISLEGKAYVINANGEETLFTNQKIENKMRIRTEVGGNISIPIDLNRRFYLKENTTVTIDLEKREDGTISDVNIALLRGEIVVIKDFKRDALSLSTEAASVIGDVCKYSVTFYPKKNVFVIKTLSGETKVFPVKASPISVQNCKKLLLKGNGEISNPISVTTKDIENINSWIGDEDLFSSDICSNIEMEKINEEPKWISTPKLKAKENIRFIDTLKANDPEGSKVVYRLVKGPKGFTVNNNSGAILYSKPVPGTYKIVVSAKDIDGESSIKSYYLTVPGKVQAVLDVPETVIINQKISISALESRNSEGERKGLKYRFDTNGDGKWDGGFSEKATLDLFFSKLGLQKIILEVKDSKGKSSIVEENIDVFEKLIFKISHLPNIGKAGTEFKISAETKKQSSAAIRWDLNNDGKWDIPVDGKFGNQFNISNMWEKKGKYPIKAEVKDNNQTAFAYDTINVYDGIVIDSISGPDTLSVNEKIKVKCFARDEKNKIIEYAWDFAGVGLFDKKGVSAEVETSYKKSGIYTIVCAVTNSAGMSVSELKEIIVLNADATVAAGGPYSTTVNKSVTVRGLGRDPDSKIVRYIWDLNNDGKFEITSSSSSETKATFKRSGDHRIIFGIVTDDGNKKYDTSFVKVSNRAPHASAGDDQLSKPGRKVKLNGVGEDPDKNIVKYEWDFDGDGKYDFVSKDSGYAEHKFETFSYPIFKVTDAEGLTSTDTLRIVICSKGMVTNRVGKFCIDKYEYPNQRKKIPVVSLSQAQAEKECAKKGKRLCKLKELESTCNNGNDRFNYPYGRKYEEYNCNTVNSRKTNNRVSWSGQYTLCATKDGVFDMTGNVAEWAAETDGEYGYAVGGWWQDGEGSASCGKFVKMKKKKGYGHIGFRCCK